MNNIPEFKLPKQEQSQEEAQQSQQAQQQSQQQAQQQARPNYQSSANITDTLNKVMSENPDILNQMSDFCAQNPHIVQNMMNAFMPGGKLPTQT